MLVITAFGQMNLWIIVLTPLWKALAFHDQNNNGVNDGVFSSELVRQIKILSFTQLSWKFEREHRAFFYSGIT
jgi:hypothetical protein